jgi:hypothetical protein
MTDFSCYIDPRDPPEKRRKFCSGPKEHHLTEAAVMVALAMDLFERGAVHVRISPDGEHAKRHDLKRTLEINGFSMTLSQGRTAYGGIYKREADTLEVKSLPGVGDVVAEVDGRWHVAECKGGVVNTTHPGQSSRLRKGLCEVIGQLMARELSNERHIAVVPDSTPTRKLADKMKDRASKAGIEIALVDSMGHVHYL